MKKLKQLIRDHVRTQVALSWIGNCEPSCRDEISENAYVAKKKLFDYLNKIADFIFEEDLQCD